MEQSEAIKDIYRRSYAIYTSGDVAAMSRFVSRHPGVVILGTDPEEWFEGEDRIAALVPTYAPVWHRTGITIRPGDARAFSEGSVGWVVDTPIFTRYGRDYPSRATTILHQEEGEWKIVHQHFSFGIPNDEVEVFKVSTGLP